MREESPDNTNDTSSTPCKAISLYHDQEYVGAWSKDGSLKSSMQRQCYRRAKDVLQGKTRWVRDRFQVQRSLNTTSELDSIGINIDHKICSRFYSFKQLFCCLIEHGSLQILVLKRLRCDDPPRLAGKRHSSDMSSPPGLGRYTLDRG